MKPLPALVIAMAVYAALIFILPEFLIWHR